MATEGMQRLRVELDYNIYRTARIGLHSAFIYPLKRPGDAGCFIRGSAYTQRELEID